MASKIPNLESLLLDPGLTPLYKPLAAREIRLLVIQPGVFRERLRCVLKTVSLDDELPRFEALSYRWNELRDTVIVDDHTISVPSDLAWFLRRLRRKATPRTVWADSICINQSDNEEKGHQVSMMREIYRRTAEAQSLRIFSYMAEQPWFSRIWTFQEAVLPNAVSVHFGVCVFPLDMMLRATQKMLYLAGTKGPPCCLSIWKRLPPLGAPATGHIEGHLWDLNYHRESAQKDNQRKGLNLPTWVPDWSRTLSVAEKGSIPLTRSSISYPGSQVFELLSGNRLRLNMVFLGSIQKALDLSDFGLEKATDAPLACDAVVGAMRACRGMVGLPTDHESTEEPAKSRDKQEGISSGRRIEPFSLGEQPTDTFHGGHAQSFFTLADGRFSLTNFECSTQDAVFATVGGLSVYLVLRPYKSTQTWPDVEEWELRGPCELRDFNQDVKKEPLQGEVYSITLV
ncbi:het-domain-containing protein [Fusarium napiforme]|uniref:Het-domain-containing protein n=1 Tax=Fusarium napiforme TaxID=42672 RepID=A0A8H5MIZ7_9HYPO|nr:het-domain-containing protein [Fusarium napiforme]